MDNATPDDESAVQQMFPNSYTNYLAQQGGGNNATNSGAVPENAPTTTTDQSDEETIQKLFPNSSKKYLEQKNGNQDASTTDTTDYGSKEWIKDVLPATIQKAPEQFVQTVEGIGHALNPFNAPETVKGLWQGASQLGSGLLSKAEGYMGAPQDKKTKDETEAMVNALGEHFKMYTDAVQGDTSALKKEFMTQGPMGPLMDASTVLSGGDLLGARLPGLLGKTAAMAGNLGSAIDPVQNAMRLTKAVAAPVTWPLKKIVPFVQAGLTGVPKQFVDLGNVAATTSTPALRNDFMRGMRTDVGAEAVQRADAALNAQAAENSKEYVAAKTALGAAPPVVPLDWQPLLDAIDNEKASTSMTTPGGGFHAHNPEAYAMIKQIEDEVRGTPTTPGLMNDPGFQNLEFFDKYKQQIGRMTYGKNLPNVTKGVMQQLYGGMKEAITQSYPDYENAMEASQANINQMRDDLAQYGTSKLPLSKKFARLNLSGRKPDDTLLKTLGQQDPGLPFLLAGHAFHEVLPSRLRTIFESPVALWAALTHPVGLPGMMAFSPRITGEMNQVVGRAAKLPQKLTPSKTAVLGQIGQLQNRMNQPSQPNPAPQPNPPFQPNPAPQPPMTSIYNSGGRVQRKSGGSVINPEKEADRLIGEAEKARKSHGKITQPLMNLPDEAITKALAIANESI